MPVLEMLAPATELAARSRASYPNETAEYRRARKVLLAEEIELRRHIERIAEQRRRLPPTSAAVHDVHLAHGVLGGRGAGHRAGVVLAMVAFAHRATRGGQRRRAAGCSFESTPTRTATNRRDYAGAADDDVLAYTVITRQDGCHPAFLERGD